MRIEDIANVFEKYGQDVDGKTNVMGQVILKGGQSFNGPFEQYNENILRMRVVVLPQNIDPASPDAQQHARLNDLYIVSGDVAAILVPAKVSSLSDPSGRKIVMAG